MQDAGSCILHPEPHGIVTQDVMYLLAIMPAEMAQRLGANHFRKVRTGRSNVNQAGQQTTELAYTKKQVFLALASVFMVYLAYSYYIQAPGTAAPRMAADLDGMPLYSWAVSIPALGLAFGTLLVGKLSDIYGRRFMMLGALGIFPIGPILNLAVLRNRSFATASGAGFLSFFGMMGMMVYYPLLLQGIQGVSAMRSGQILTPFGFLMSFPLIVTIPEISLHGAAEAAVRAP
jgi:hypothetical protein